MYMDQDSIFHVVDRFMAIPSFVFEARKMFLLWTYSRWHIASGNTVLLLLAAGAFLLSQRAQSHDNRDGFVLWHNIWHM